MSLINTYPTKPSFEPVLDGKRTFSSLWLGVELEFEVESPEYLKECAIMTHRTLKDFVILKEDGSLEVGFEICSRPALLEVHKKIWMPFFEHGLNHFQLFKCEKDEITGAKVLVENCGMHVHINRKPLSTLQIGKMIAFIHASKNCDFINRIAGREGNQYSRFGAGDMTFRHAKQEYYRNLPKQRGMNLHHPTTVEIRIFKGTKDKNIFFKNLEFCDALVNFTLPSCTSIPDSQKIDSFVEFIRQQPCRYENLIKFLK